MRSVRARPRRPDHALIFLRDRSETFVRELLHALALVGLRYIDVPFRVDRDAVRAEELTRLAPAVAEAGEQLQRLPLDDVDLLIAAVRQIQIFLLRVFRERDVPYRAVGERPLRDELFLDEFAFRRELQHLAVVGAVAADPDVAFVVDRDAVVRLRPLVVLTGTGPAPRAQKVAGLIELEHGRRAFAAFTGRWIELRAALVGVQRGGAAMDDPDVILGVDRHADRRAEQPVIGKRFRPHRIHFEARRLRAAFGLRRSGSLERELSDEQCRQERDERAGNQQMTLRPHTPPYQAPRRADSAR